MLLPLHIALLELKMYLVNRGELAFSLALPVALFVVMYGAFGGEESFHATAHIVDLDGGEHSRALVRHLNGLDEITVEERTLEDANRDLDSSSILTAVIIPPGFSNGLDGGEPVSITFKKRGNGGDSGQIVQTLVQAVAQNVTTETRIRSAVTRALDGSAIPQNTIDTLVAEQLAGARRLPPFGIEVRVSGSQSSDPLYRLVPGLLVMFVMFTVTIGAQTLVIERQNGTLERLLTTRLSVNQLFVGKFLSGAVRATSQAIILLSLAFAVLRIGDAIDFGELLVFSTLVAASVSAVGLVIGSVARTRDQAIWAGVVFTMFMTIFGGTFFDLASAGPLEAISRVTLTRYAIDAMFAIIGGGESLLQQGVAAAVLAGFTLGGLLIARLLFGVAGTER